MKREDEEAQLTVQGKVCRGLHLTKPRGGGGQDGGVSAFVTDWLATPPRWGALSAG